MSLLSQETIVLGYKDHVSISGERKEESKSEDKGVTRYRQLKHLSQAQVTCPSEFRSGKFSRVIPLPVRIQNTNVTAEYKDGILNLTLPKSEEEKNKVVKVNLLQEETAQ